MNPSSGADDFPVGMALVVGASGGIGQGIARRLAASGCKVVLTYRRGREAADGCVSGICESGGYAESLHLPLGDLAGVQAALAPLAARLGALHTVVYAVGADISMTYVANIDPQEWRETVDGDLHGFFHITKACLPLMRSAGGASFVAITTAGLDRHPPLDILSTVPKAGIEALIRGIAREEGRYNIRANTVAPGVIDAGLFHRLTPQVTPQFVEAMKRNTALRRFGSPEEVAAVVVFLASTPAAYVTGQRILVDGGFAA